MVKFYNQSGTEFQRTSLFQSDNICPCCQGYDHASAVYHPDDAECRQCGTLCCCDCHRHHPGGTAPTKNPAAEAPVAEDPAPSEPPPAPAKKRPAPAKKKSESRTRRRA